jgi:pyridoxal phosphate enzyme (YggS family)
MVRKDIREFIKTIPSSVTVVAASKYVDANDIKVLLSAGINNIGENRVDNFLEKYELLKNEDIKWHFIGHLQRNKALDVIDKIDFLESLDSLKLAEIINSHRLSPLKCFVEVSINLEENKNGVPYFALSDFIEQILKMKNINLVGLMMMAKANSSDDSLCEQFKKLRLLRDEMEKKFSINLPYLSMGMSDDYQIAIKEGATHIRLGRILFGLI